MPCLAGLLCLLAACGSQPSRLSDASQRGSYAVPGTPDDPWGPYIDEAARRLAVPSSWIRAVMHQESGGNEYLDGQPITSGAGAMGLMQLMPSTYADLQSQYDLGGDPYDPHDNILAGTAYIRQMYDKYGSPGFLAAYNAGPARVDDYLAGQSSLPAETVNYVAAITPHLDDAAPAAEPAVEVAEATPPPALASAPAAVTATTACWHDPNAAYDPDAPCQSPPVVEQLPAATVPSVPSQPAVRTVAYDPAPSAIGRFDAPPPPSGMPALPPPRVSFSPAPVLRASYAPPPRRTGGSGAWAIQVGAFGQSSEAVVAAAVARRAAPDALAVSRPRGHHRRRSRRPHPLPRPPRRPRSPRRRPCLRHAQAGLDRPA